ncbi:hypothetical protein [Rhizobium wuzhouense]|uniref:Uncharacterized protein n=1 Tax=Rhizobium wuzhouense TaxID=1986026 RepID=A0ABX5NVB8_9HYPH|nr:hypothetical protein [Rhizobium wuzhouense]PYB73336.1 hypothetical protein DMY87_13650 [Rhizobium wuzhouense]
MRAQLDLFGLAVDLAPAEPASYKPDPDRVRGKLAAVLSEMRAADTMPWDRKKRAYHQLLFPQMTRSLPPEEAEVLRAAFDVEWQRLTAA